MSVPLADFLDEPLLLLSMEGEIKESNRAAQRLLIEGNTAGNFSEMIDGDINALDPTLRVWARSGAFIRGLVSVKSHSGERYITFGTRAPTEDGTEPMVLVRCQPDHSANERFIEITQRMSALNREISRRKAMERQLFAEKELAQVTLRSIGDAVITTDTNGRIDYLNPVAETLTGWTEIEARGKPLTDVFCIVNEQTREPVASPVAQVLAHGNIVGLANHTVLLSRDGTEFAIDDSAAPIRDRAGILVGVVMVFHDVTQARRLADEVSYQATHDWLTGLLNRQAFEHRLNDILKAPGAMDSTHTLLFLDLDRFKIINDTCGHAAGDALLRSLGPLLQTHLRHSDLLARLGGDEFGVLLQDCPEPVASNIAKALKEALEGFSFVWEGKPFDIGVSIGQVNFSDSAWALQDLINAADNACYMAKETGRNRIHVHRSDDQGLAIRFQQSQWVGRIREALREDHFRLYCQLIRPIAPGQNSAAEHHGAHFEILLRLRNADGEIIAPMAFIPAAERYDLMVRIDRWVIKTAFDCLARTGCEHVGTCSINLSGASLGDEHFLGYVRKCLKRYNIPPYLICFEITETEAIANLANARQVIVALKALGCRFSLDDFGSGMSSFGYLKNLPVDYLKIDGTFVTDMAEDPIDHAMVSAINDIGHVIGLETIAEFVETPSVLQSLSDLGVDYAQGYGVAKPEPFEGVLAKLGEQARQSMTIRH